MSNENPHDFLAAVRAVFGGGVQPIESVEDVGKRAVGSLPGPGPYLDDCTHTHEHAPRPDKGSDVIPTSTGDKAPWGAPYTEVRTKKFRDGTVEMNIIERSGGFNPNRAKGKKKQGSRSRSEMDDDVAVRSASRAKRVIREACCQLMVDRMFTFTFRENVDCVDEFWLAIGYFVTEYRKELPYTFYLGHQKFTVESLDYVLVPELQKRGAYHGHVGVHGPHDINRMRRCWHKAQEKLGLRSPDGNVNVKRFRHSPRNRMTKARTIAGYLAKYLSKDLKGGDMYRKRYSKTNGIPQPETSAYYFVDHFTDDELIEFVALRTNARPTGITRHWNCAGQPATYAMLAPP